MTFFKNNKFLTIVLLIFSFFIFYYFTREVEPNPNIDKTSIQYVNELYMSDGMVYNKFLNDKEKKIYMLFLNSFKNYVKEENVKIEDYDYTDINAFFDAVHKVYDALETDHPELINFSSYSGRYEDNILTIKFEYSIDSKIKEEIGILRIKRIISDIKNSTRNMSDKEKIIYVYKWIGNNNTYDKIFTYNSKNQSIYNVFMNKNAVCAGFAKASQVLLQNVGINSYGVTGYSTGPHMWNIVELDGKYYMYDSTYAAGSNKKEGEFFLGGLKQSNMTSYKIDYPEWFPEVSTEEVFK